MRKEKKREEKFISESEQRAIRKRKNLYKNDNNNNNNNNNNNKKKKRKRNKEIKIKLYNTLIFSVAKNISKERMISMGERERERELVSSNGEKNLSQRFLNLGFFRR